MDCRICMSPLTTSLYTDQSTGTVIDFMRKHHLELVPIVDLTISLLAWLAQKD